MVIDVEIAREAGAGEGFLVPRAVRTLALAQEVDSALGGGMAAQAGDLESVDGPGGLRRRARADAGERLVDVRVARFAPAAVGVLHREQPVRSAFDHVAAGF